MYTLQKYGRTVWRVMCGVRVDCCLLMNEFDSEEEAVRVWNSRWITKQELLAALEVMRKREGAYDAEAKKYVGDTKPSSGAGRADNTVSSAGILPAAGRSNEAEITGNTRDAEHGS